VGITFDELRERRKPREQTVDIPLDEDLLRQIDAIEQALPLQRHLDESENRTPQAPDLERKLKALQLEAEDAAETFTFRELPRPVYRDLMAEHPDPDGKLRWNEDTFAPALIAATCVSHDYTTEQWTQLWDEWAGWVVWPLFATAFEVCEQPSRVPFGVRSSSETPGSEPNSDTAPTEG
jgi:hypothetical protein